MRELFLNCSSGVAGDMLAGALLELFDNRDEIIERLNSIGIPGIHFSAEKTEKHSITGTHLSVRYKGLEEEQGSCSDHHDHKHAENMDDHGVHHHHHAGVSEINSLIDTLSLPGNIKNDVKNVYRIIAEAESTVHGCPMDYIHFHELGTMDAVADISAVCLMKDALKVDKVTVSPISTGFGEVCCAHGVLPVPAPATALILTGIPSFAGETEGELCTPTGAALVKYLADNYGQCPEMTVRKVGYGMGKKDFPKLSAVRACLGDTEETIIELCCNVDDMSPEAVGFAIDELLRSGAPDAYYEPIGMKKNRPGLLLTCLCREGQRDEMVRLIFRHTSTLGIRETLCRRYVLKREQKTEETPYGNVRIKLSEGYGVKRKKAEFDDLARLARENELPFCEIKKIAES